MRRWRNILAAGLHAEFPAVAVRVMKPDAHVPGTGRFRADLIAGIFDLRADALQMRERFAQGAHVRQMKRHVTEGLRRRLPFVQRDGDVLVSDGHSAVELEFLLQAERALKPLRALARIAHGKSEMPDLTKREWNLRPARLLLRRHNNLSPRVIGAVLS